MSKEYLNALLIDEIKFRLSKGEKIFNDTDDTSYAKYVDGIGICKFRKSNDELLVVNMTLTLFSQLYFKDLKEEYKSMIGCVGWFWDDKQDKEYKRLGILTGMEEGYFCDERVSRWINFRPAKKFELKFWEIGEGKAPYDYMLENIELNGRLKKTQELELEVRKENTKLKDLLKECLEVFNMVAGETRDFPYSVDECIDKIKQVLGESK